MKPSVVQIINGLIADLPSEDPLKYLETMYASINPLFPRDAVQAGKLMLQKLNDKKGKQEVNVHFTMGQENATRSRIEGFFSGILFIEEYVRAKGDTYGVTASEMKTYSTVLRKMGVPQTNSAYVPEGRTYDIRSYEGLLTSWLMWLSNGSLANTSGAKVTRSNKEVCSCLTASTLASYPAVPFASYYVGTIKTNRDVLDIAKEMHKVAGFEKMLTDEFRRVNEPKYIVTNASSPVVNMVNHPLTALTYGILDQNKQVLDWFAGYSTSREFERLASNAGISLKDVDKYMLTHSASQHEAELALNNPIAKFIDGQKITKQIYKNLRKRRGLESKKGEYIPAYME